MRGERGETEGIFIFVILFSCEDLAKRGFALGGRVAYVHEGRDIMLCRGIAQFICFFDVP